MKLGKKPARRDHRDLRLSKYLKGPLLLPAIPAQFGHEAVIKDWGMLGNDAVGCCVISGAGHETMLLTALGGLEAVFDTSHTLADYSAITGYNPTDPNSDQGTDVRQSMAYRQDTGVADSLGNRHKIAAYVALDPGNLDHLRSALYLFGAVGIGIEFPGSAMDQFNAGQPWSVVPNAQIEGGHYVPLVAVRDNLVCVTWGALQQITADFYRTYCDEAWAFISEEFLQGGKSPEGFDLQALVDDFNAISGAPPVVIPVPDPVPAPPAPPAPVPTPDPQPEPQPAPPDPVPPAPAPNPPTPVPPCPETGIPNFYVVDDVQNITRGAQPVTLAHWQALKDRGTLHVIKLNTQKESEDDDTIARMLGMDVTLCPITLTQQLLTEPDLNTVKTAVGFIDQNTFVHCGSADRTRHAIAVGDASLAGGQDRTGLIIALYRIKTGWTAEAARQEMLSMGFHTILLGLDKAWSDLSVTCYHSACSCS